MKILIMGGAGMIGQKLLNLILRNPKLRNKQITEITLFDIIDSPYPSNTAIPIIVKSGDISNQQTSVDIVSSKPDIIFHLAAIVSGQAEQEFDLGWNINAKGSWGLFEAIRDLGDELCNYDWKKETLKSKNLSGTEDLFILIQNKFYDNEKGSAEKYDVTKIANRANNVFKKIPSDSNFKIVY